MEKKAPVRPVWAFLRKAALGRTRRWLTLTRPSLTFLTGIFPTRIFLTWIWTPQPPSWIPMPQWSTRARLRALAVR